MRLSEFDSNPLDRCPFPKSVVQSKLYHGTTAKFDRFDRSLHGIYVTPVESWAREHYGDNVIPLYADVKKAITLDWQTPADDKIIDLFYDRDYEALQPVIQKWTSQGYNCCKFGGESDSMILFGKIRIVNANTGKPM